MPFHGIVRRGKMWLRLLTSAPLLESDQVLEEFNSGSYEPAFLNHFFPDRYRLEVRKIHSKRWGRFKSDPAAPTNYQFSSEEIRWSTASDQYVLRIKGTKGWLSSFKEIGLFIKNSKKMSKRLAELSRVACAWLFDEDGSIKVGMPIHNFPEKYVDGISAISRNLAIRCVQSNTNASARWRAKQIWKIYTGETAVVELRMLTPNGLIKGNALVLPAKQMQGFDVLTFEPNIKPEIYTSGWQWITINPSYGAIPVKSDDLSHSIYWRVKGLYDDASLINSLKSMLNAFFEDVKSGKRSEWLTKLIEHQDEILHEDIEEKFDTDRGLVYHIQNAVARLDKLGVPLTASQTLMFYSVNGLKMQLLTKKTVEDENGQFRKLESWEDKSRHWFPVPWAYAAHVVTHEVLQLFGFPVTKKPWGFFHEKTHCFAVPGEFFEANYSNHGGWDEDDTGKILIRTNKGQLGAMILRNPNAFGEWSFIPVVNPGPVFHTYTDTPPELDLDELQRLVPQYSTVEHLLDVGELPGTKSLKLGETYSLEDEERVRSASRMFPAGTGGATIPKMLHAALVGGHIESQVCSNEDIIDTLQTGSGTPEDIALIAQNVADTFKIIAEETGGEIDAFWYYTRLFDKLADEFGLYAGEISDSKWIALHREREALVKSSISEMVDWVNNNITMPDVIENIEFTPAETASMKGELARIKRFQASTQTWAEDFVKMLERSDAEMGEQYTNRKILILVRAAFEAKDKFPSNNHDKWLYSFSAKIEKQPVDWFIRALKDHQKTSR
jgi:hypothetical protein